MLAILIGVWFWKRRRPALNVQGTWRTAPLEVLKAAGNFRGILHSKVSLESADIPSRFRSVLRLRLSRD